jgi:hypothetical protein
MKTIINTNRPVAYAGAKQRIANVNNWPLNGGF